ncbi:MAG TPA: hypothetical protein VJK03_04135 [Candidatus Nanoarchaeia archaeon]|nr:hypothetical protein [Candidatus Nanoarchaeia archaeon]
MNFFRGMRRYYAGESRGGITLFISIFIGIYTHLLTILIPFVRYNHLHNWDMAGLYFSAWYQHAYLFPRIIGWNPFFFFGYPQHQFYPPLFAYVTAALSYLASLDVAFKILVVAIVLATPLSFYYFARSFSFSKTVSAVTMLLMYALLFVVSDSTLGAFGGDLYSTLEIGLVTQALAITLFFFYCGTLEQHMRKGRIIASTLLLSLIILSNVMIAVAAIVALVAWSIVRVRSLPQARKAGLHAGISFLLTAFWTIPFLAKLPYSHGTLIGEFSASFLVIAFFIALFCFLSYRKRNAGIAFLALFLALILIIAAAASWLLLPLHPYRWFILLLLCLPPLILSIFFRTQLHVLAILTVLAVVFISVTSPLHSAGSPAIEVPSLIADDARLFVVAPYLQEPSPHYLQHVIPRTSEMHGVKGLYAESSRHADIVFYLEREIDSHSLAWGTSLNVSLLPAPDVVSQILPAQLRALGIQYIIAPSDILSLSMVRQKEFFVARYDAPPISQMIERKQFGRVTGSAPIAERAEIPYALYDFGAAPLAEVLLHEPRVVSRDDWDSDVAQWFLSEDVAREILVDEPVPHVIGDGGERVDIIDHSPTWEQIVMNVTSQKPVPILIKMSYFPNWHAYQNGTPLKIYRASPYFMLVYGKGEIELRYEKTWSDLLGMWLSIAGLIILAILCCKTHDPNRTSN